MSTTPNPPRPPAAPPGGSPPSGPSSSSSSLFYDPAIELASLVESYHRSGDVGVLFDQLRALAKRTSPALLKSAVQPYREMPEVVIPIFERIVADFPDDAQSMVVLANSYWLAGRGPDAVGALASRAKEIDPSNRGAWHLWALAESSVRRRVERWLEVTKRFPADQLARAALADNATSLASDEDDPVALKLAISTYEGLLAETKAVAQRLALEETLKKLREWNR
jgi:cytochrome c-type biogenesis protein CcmH/NrfG